jgi:hypothetical protein
MGGRSCGLFARYTDAVSKRKVGRLRVFGCC